MQFKSTRESGDGDSRIYWGSNSLTINVDNGDQPVNIDIRQEIQLNSICLRLNVLSMKFMV